MSLGSSALRSEWSYGHAWYCRLRLRFAPRLMKNPLHFLQPRRVCCHWKVEVRVVVRRVTSWTRYHLLSLSPLRPRCRVSLPLYPAPPAVTADHPPEVCLFDELGGTRIAVFVILVGLRWRGTRRAIARSRRTELRFFEEAVACNLYILCVDRAGGLSSTAMPVLEASSGKGGPGEGRMFAEVAEEGES